MTSFAQNLEDVLLARALRTVERGFYVDVGAGDPVVNSVTKAFYDAGWSGINVEPIEAVADRLSAERPRDVTLCLALGERAGQLTLFHDGDNPELSTTLAEVADLNVLGGRTVSETTVPVDTLNSVLEQHVPPGQEIHFLKIDVEGAEAAVLAGADFTKFRPWIVVVEVVTYGREAAGRPAAISLLIDAGYRLVYFDGLNEFYLAKEHERALKPHFAVPVNVRDDYTIATGDRSRAFLARIAAELGLETFTSEQEVLERTLALLRDRIEFEKRSIAAEEELASQLIETETSRQRLFERDRLVASQAVEVNQLRYEMSLRVAGTQEILRSTSWRITLPLRVVRRPRNYLRRLLRRRP